MRRVVLLLLTGLTGAALVLAGGSAAGAHPLGNFTVNRYARIEVSAGVLRLHYVLDEAEVPAFQERDAVDADPEGFATKRAEEIRLHLQLVVDGAPVALRSAARALSRPPGQGGLSTLRLAVVYELPVPGGPGDRHRVTFSDANEPDRVGWREVVVVGLGNAQVLSSDTPDRDVSDELRSYPADLTSSPLDRRSARFEFTPGSVVVGASPLTASATAPARSGSGFTSLLTRDAALPLLLALALLAGCGHAVLPGHGKTVMAAYLVGTRGRARDAFFLGGIVSLMHTLSVLALGLVLFRVSREVSADRVYTVLEVVAGLFVTGVGLWLLARRLRRPHHHDHGDAHDDQGDDHHHGLGGDHHQPDHPRGEAGGHKHSHDLSETMAPLSRRGLVALATAGGLFPSPSAVIVVVSAFSLHRAGLGLALIAAFSVGLAATLTAVGLALVLGRNLVEHSALRRATAWLPLVAAAVITVLGAVLLVRGLSKL